MDVSLPSELRYVEYPGGSRVVVVVISFLFVLGTNGRMQPVVMAPKNLSTKHYGLNKRKEKDNTAEENTREKQKKDPRET